MNRVCVIDIAGLSPRLLRADGSLWINSLPFGPRPVRPTFPAVSASVQASMTTGREPGQHGVIAGGLYRRQACQPSFDERSNTLLSKKRFWHGRSLPQRPKVSLLFWHNPLAGAADVVLGAMTYGPSGVSLADSPVGLYGDLAARIGTCHTSFFRGPKASWAASSWVASAAEEIWRDQKPDLQWVYLPGVDFEIVRHGVDSAHAREALKAVDLLAHRLAETVARGGGRTIVLSGGGYVGVSRVGMPNLLLQRAGLLRTVRTDLGELVDYENSQAIAMTDHQIAHVYCKDDAAAARAAEALSGCPSVDRVARREELFCEGQGRERAGDLVLLAKADAWFSYRWWADDAQAPRCAARWDVAGKCGFDPCEFFEPIGQAQLGQIDPNPANVRASRGLIPADPADYGAIAATCPLPAGENIAITDLPEIVTNLMFK